MSTSVVEKQEPHAIVGAKQTAPATITEMISLAIEKGMTAESLEKLVALHERVSDRAARQEFFDRLADFQRHCPPIKKTKTAEIVTKKGGKFTYPFADLDNIQETVRDPLHDRGFSYSWDSSVAGKALTAVCSLRHVNGHVETSAFTLTVDSASAMSEQQQYVAALTFAKRMTLVSVLGLRLTDPDTDGADPTPISEEYAIQIEEMIEVTSADPKRFLQYMGVDSIREIRRSHLNKALTSLEARAKQQARGKKVDA